VNISETRKQMVDTANEIAFKRMTTADPKLETVMAAKEVVPGMGSRILLHSGPAEKYDKLPGTTRGALIGAMIYEEWASSEEEADRRLREGYTKIEPCFDHDVVGAMAGVLSPSMPVFVIGDEQGGKTIRAFTTINEGLGKVLRFGFLGPEVYNRLKWIEKVFGPAMNLTIEKTGPIRLKPIIAESIRRGDEVHNRNKASTSAFYVLITPKLLKTSMEKEIIYEVMEFMAGNVHFFLNLSMGAAKVITLSGQGIKNSSIVTTMFTNGCEFGITLSGTGNRLYKAPARMVDAKYFKGFSERDACPHIGDSMIIETAGYGAFALAASPAIIEFIGGTVEYAIEITNKMRKICYGSNPDFLIPILNYSGTPTGIDVLKVCETGIVPMMDAGVAHKEAGKGQIGAGIASAPLACFEEGLRELISRFD